MNQDTMEPGRFGAMNSTQEAQAQALRTIWNEQLELVTSILLSSYFLYVQVRLGQVKFEAPGS